MANIREIAQLAGVSVGTVSRYLNGVTVRDVNAKAIADVVNRLGYRPSIVARSLAKNESYTIGVLMANAGNVFVGSSIGRLETKLERIGYSALFIDFHNDTDVLQQKIDFLQSRQVDAIVIFLSEVEDAKLRNLTNFDCPVIVVDNPIPSDKIDSIVVDNSESSCRVISEMIKFGHNRIGIIASSQETYVGRERLSGWRRAYIEAGLPIHDEDIVTCNSTKTGGYAAARKLMNYGAVSAIFASNYYMALGALKAMNELEVRPGVDMGFASFDDYDFSDVLYPPLTVICQPMNEIVDLIMRMVCHRLDGNTDDYGVHVLKCNVLMTESVRKPSAILPR